MAEDKKAIVKMAYIFSQEGRWDKAIEEYKKILKIDSEDFNNHAMLGDAYVKRSEVQLAFDSYIVAAEAYSRLGQTEKSSVIYRKISKLESSKLNPEAQQRQSIFKKQAEAEAAMEAGEVDAAIEAFKAVLEMDRDRFDLYQKLGDLYLRKGEKTLAIKQYLDIAQIYLTNKLYKKAAPVYTKVIEIDPQNVDAHAAMGEIHAKNANESDAKKEFLLVTETLLNKGELEGALTYAQKAVQLKSIEAYYFLGQVYYRQDKFDLAKAEFERLLKFKMNHVGARVLMARIHERNNAMDEALKQLEAALKSEAENPDALEAMGSVLRAKGQKAEAADYFAKAGQAQKKAGNEDEALALASQAMALDPANAIAKGLTGASDPAAPAPAPAPAAAAPAPVVVEVPAAAGPVAAAPAAEPIPPLPPLPSAPEPQPETAVDPEEERRQLLALAENYEAEGALDEAIEVYQRVTNTWPDDGKAKDALAHLYSRVAQGMMGSVPRANDEEQRAQAEAKRMEDERQKAETERLRVEAERKALEEARAAAEAAQKKAEEEANKAGEEAKKKAEEAAAEAKLKAAEAEAALKAKEGQMRKDLEAQIRAQLEEEMRRKVEDEVRRKSEEDIQRKVEEARHKAEDEARRSVETEMRAKFEEEKKKLESEKLETRKQLEDELRSRLEQEAAKKVVQQVVQKSEAVRQVEEKAAKEKIQQDVLARVQAQQKERTATYQKTIDDIRKKVESSRDAARVPVPAAGAPAPAPLPEAEAPAGVDEMDDFMTAAVADIYVTQGLTTEAVRIYQRILSREPGNAEIRAKLEALGIKPQGAPRSAAPAVENDPKRKSKVSYL